MGAQISKSRSKHSKLKQSRICNIPCDSSFRSSGKKTPSKHMEVKPSCLSGSHNDIISANNWKCNRNIENSYVIVSFGVLCIHHLPDAG